MQGVRAGQGPAKRQRRREEPSRLVGRLVLERGPILVLAGEASAETGHPLLDLLSSLVDEWHRVRQKQGFGLRCGCRRVGD